MNEWFAAGDLEPIRMILLPHFGQDYCRFEMLIDLPLLFFVKLDHLLDLLCGDGY